MSDMWHCMNSVVLSLNCCIITRRHVGTTNDVAGPG